MPAKLPKPTTMLSPAPVAKLRSAKTVRSRIGSWVVSSRIRKQMSAKTATMLSTTIVREANQSSRSPRSRTSCRHPKPATMRPRPHQSMRAARQIGRIEQEDARHEEADDADRQIDVEDPPP